jgi:hypothetical protein
MIGRNNTFRFEETKSEAASIIEAPRLIFFQQQHIKMAYSPATPHATPAPIVAYLKFYSSFSIFSAYSDLLIHANPPRRMNPIKIRIIET